MNEPPTSKCKTGPGASQPLVSVIINNYNYAAYLPAAIESALKQDYNSVEVLVVDDGSTDSSREIISAFEPGIAAIYKTNCGQASAFNVGFAASRGEIILFLDADDILLPTAATSTVAAFAEANVSNVHWPMWLIDANGTKTGGTHPSKPPGDGDLRERLLELGPTNLPATPTSGNAWSRALLDRIFPIPEDVFRLCADDYLYNLAPAFGRVKTIARPQSCYRIHGRNNYSSRSFSEKLDIEVQGYEQQCRSLAAALAHNGISVDTARWQQHSWFHRLARAVSEIVLVVAPDCSLVLVEGGEWDAAGAFGSRAVRPFIERHGLDWGPPPDCDYAIEQLEAIRREGIQYVVFGWNCFWWFDAYPKFAEHLEHTATCVFRNDCVAIFCLDPPAGWLVLVELSRSLSE